MPHEEETHNSAFYRRPIIVLINNILRTAGSATVHLHHDNVPTLSPIALVNQGMLRIGHLIGPGKVMQLRFYTRRENEMNKGYKCQRYLQIFTM